MYNDTEHTNNKHNSYTYDQGDNNTNDGKIDNIHDDANNTTNNGTAIMITITIISISDLHVYGCIWVNMVVFVLLPAIL